MPMYFPLYTITVSQVLLGQGCPGVQTYTPSRDSLCILHGASSPILDAVRKSHFSCRPEIWPACDVLRCSCTWCSVPSSYCTSVIGRKTSLLYFPTFYVKPHGKWNIIIFFNYVSEILCIYISFSVVQDHIYVHLLTVGKSLMWGSNVCLKLIKRYLSCHNAIMDHKHGTVLQHPGTRLLWKVPVLVPLRWTLSVHTSWKKLRNALISTSPLLHCGAFLFFGVPFWKYNNLSQQYHCDINLSHLHVKNKCETSKTLCDNLCEIFAPVHQKF